MRSATFRQDERAQIYPSADEIQQKIESRDDIHELRREYRALADIGLSQSSAAKRICGKIKCIKDILCDDIVSRNCEAYFKEADRLRALRKPTDHLWNPEATTHRLKHYMDTSTAAEVLGGFMSEANDSR
jgi:hypothetical protein